MTSLDTITLRRIRPDEAEVVRAFRQQVFHEAPAAFITYPEEEAALPLDEMRARLGAGEPESRFALGAFAGERLVGMVGVRREPRRKVRHKASIWGMYVIPEVRSLGLGRRLLIAAIDEARKMPGVEQLLLGVVATNVAACSLYRSLGFKSYGREPRAIRLGDTYLDEEFMVLPLS